VLSVVGVLDDAVGAREHQRLVPVVEAHEVRRSTVRTADLDDLTLALPGADRAASYVEHVTDFGSHQITSTPQGRTAGQAGDPPEVFSRSEGFPAPARHANPPLIEDLRIEPSD
jgi:hypothetical protein